MGRKTKSDNNTILWEDSAHGPEEVKPVCNQSLRLAARRHARTLSLCREHFWRKDKVMENGRARPRSPARPSAAPQVIFVNWRERLHLLKLGRGLKHTYTQAIEGYLADRTDLPGMGVAVGTFRGAARAGVGHRRGH